MPNNLLIDLYPHQVEAFNEIMNYNKYLLLDGTGCISGDMVITCNRSNLSRKYTLRKLYKKYKRLLDENKDTSDFYVRCLLGDHFGLNHVENIVYSGDKEVFKITLDNGKYVEATCDHRILTDNGYVKVDNLAIGNIIITDWSDISNLSNELNFGSNIVKIESMGIKDTYDISMASPYNNFIANGVVVHNCGKTLTAIAVALKRKEQGAKHTIVICLNSLTYNWLNEIQENCSESACILGARKNKKGQLHVKNNSDKLEDLENLNTYFAITNMESLQNKDIVKQLKKMCKDDIINIVVDEMHKGISNPTSLQGKAFRSINPTYGLGMSATLFVNSPLNLFVPLEWVGIEKSKWTAFQNHYAIKGNFNAVIGYKHLDELQAKLDRCSLRREKTMLNLPSISYKVEQLVMHKEQEKVYNDIKKSIVDNIDKIMLSPNPLAQLTRLRQCTDSPELLSTSVTKSVKLDRLVELIEDIKARGEKVIIFSNWAEVIKLTNQRLSKYNYVSVTGSVKDREPLYDKFKTDDNCFILTATVACVGVGLTLVSANNVIFLDEPWNYATFEQAFSRIYRIGQEKPCLITSLICKYTVDEKIHNLVYKKKKLGDAILDVNINLKDPEVIKELLA